MPTAAEHVDRAARRWGLTVREPLGGGSRSTVYAVTGAGGEDLVLKIPAPRDDGQAAAFLEAAALASWRESGAAVNLRDAMGGALLLERARPGTGWPWRAEHASSDDMVDLAGELLSRLWATPVPVGRWPTVEGWYPAAERIAREDAALEQRERTERERGLPGLLRLADARSAAQDLCTTTPAPRLLHGDFITKNLVSHAGSALGWVALDPLPMVGDRCCEVGTFAAYQPAELILPVAESLARRAGVDPGRSLRWAAIWTVHQSAQAWRDDQEEIDAVVEADVRLLLRS